MQIGDCQELRGGENEEQLNNGYGFSFLADENILKPDRGSGYTTL